jgi:hypothetical protein
MKDRPHNQESSQNKHRDRAPVKDGDKLPENSKENLDRKLDEGVEETFPASDPVSVKITK